MRRRLRPVIVALIGLIGACDNAGEDRILSLDANGVVRGLVFFDRNGDREADASDVTLAGVRLGLVAVGTRDTVARGTSDGNGAMSLAGVPVGPYLVVVDSESVGDTAQVVGIDSAEIAMRPGDTVTVDVTVSFPIVSVAEARALPIGARVFVEGVALTGRNDFGDAAVHLADTSGALRATRVSTVGVFRGDSVRLRGGIAAQNGQRTLDQVEAFTLAIAAVPPPVEIETGTAASAGGGGLDAALVRVLDATIMAVDTLAGELEMMVDDGSGVLEVVLDRDIDFDFTPFVPSAMVTVTGVLVPTNPGMWVLKPRSAGDVVVQ